MSDKPRALYSRKLGNCRYTKDLSDLEIHESRYLGDHWNSVNDLIVSLIPYSESGSIVEIETEDYGDYHVGRLVLHGWRKATPQEIQTVEKEKEEDKIREQKNIDSQIERLKKIRPEVFK